jgi:hypothetical protein
MATRPFEVETPELEFKTTEQQPRLRIYPSSFASFSSYLPSINSNYILEETKGTEVRKGKGLARFYRNMPFPGIKMLMCCLVCLALLLLGLRYVGMTVQQQQLRSMVAAASAVLERHHVSYWWDFGTLLGLVREGDIIWTETDADISVFLNGSVKIWNSASGEMEEDDKHEKGKEDKHDDDQVNSSRKEKGHKHKGEKEDRKKKKKEKERKIKHALSAVWSSLKEMGFVRIQKRDEYKLRIYNRWGFFLDMDVWVLTGDNCNVSNYNYNSYQQQNEQEHEKISPENTCRAQMITGKKRPSLYNLPADWIVPLQRRIIPNISPTVAVSIPNKPADVLTYWYGPNYTVPKKFDKGKDSSNDKFEVFLWTHVGLLYEIAWTFKIFARMLYYGFRYSTQLFIAWTVGITLGLCFGCTVGCCQWVFDWWRKISGLKSGTTTTVAKNLPVREGETWI